MTSAEYLMLIELSSSGKFKVRTFKNIQEKLEILIGGYNGYNWTPTGSTQLTITLEIKAKVETSTSSAEDTSDDGTGTVVQKTLTTNFAPIFFGNLEKDLKITFTSAQYNYDLPAIFDLNKGDTVKVEVKNMRGFMSFDETKKQL